MSDPINEIIEEALGVSEHHTKHWDKLVMSDLRAVCEAGIKHGNRLTTDKLIEARKLMEANNAAQESATKARRELARELLREGFELIDNNGRRRHVIETYKVREIAEERE